MEKKRHLFGCMEGCPVFTRLTAHQIVVHEGCFKEKPCHKKLRPPRLCATLPKSPWWLGSNVRRVRDRQKKVTLFLIKYGAKSMQTFQHACSVAFFQLFVRIDITLERTIIFTLNLVVLCQIISSTSSENLKEEYKFLAELLRFR